MSDTSLQYEPSEMASGLETPGQPFEYFSIVGFAKDTLSSIGGVVFQKNTACGLLIVLALLLNSWAAGFACLFGSAVSTLTGMALKSPRRLQDSGILGLNGALAGAAFVTFTKDNTAAWIFPGLLLWFWIALAAATCTVMVTGLAALLHSRRLPVLSFPFCAATWVFLAALHQFAGMGAPAASQPATVAPAGSVLLTVFDGTVNGFAQIFFQQGLLPGLLIIFAIAINSRVSALLALAGCFLATAGGLLLGAPAGVMGSGVYGSNAALTTLLLGGLFVFLEVGGLGYAFAGALLSGIVSAAAVTVLQPLGLPVLFLPFVTVSWLMMAAMGGFRRVPPAFLGRMLALEYDPLPHADEPARCSATAEECATTSDPKEEELWQLK